MATMEDRSGRAPVPVPESARDAANPAEVQFDQRRGCYMLVRDGDVIGRLDTHERSGAVVATHTEVDAELGGRGMGNQLVAAMLGDVRRRGLKVVPACSFVAAYLRRHPEDADLEA